MTNIERLPNETNFEWELRLCLLKRRKEIDLDWIEIRDILGLEVTPDCLRKRAVGYHMYDDYLNSRDSGGATVAVRILSLSDFHVPFHLPADMFKDYANKVDVLVLNGDLQDCQSISSFPKKYRVNFVDEMVATRQYIIELINILHPKRVLITKGNHEHRLGRFLSDSLNEDLMQIMPDTPLDLIVNDGFKNRDRLNKTETWYAPLTEVFKGSGTEIVYTGDWKVKVGKTIFAHPLSYSSGMLKTTEKAVEWFLRNDRDFECICLGHTHKLGSYIQGDIQMYEQGCCADLGKLDYRDGKLTLPGQNGFLYMCQDVEGKVIPDKTKLVIL